MALINYKKRHNDTFHKFQIVILTTKMHLYSVGTGFEQVISNSILKHKKH